LGAGGKEDGRKEFGDGQIIFAVGVTAHAALEAGAVGGEEWNSVTGKRNVFGGLDCRPDSGRVEGSDGAEAGVEEKLWGIGVRDFVSSLLWG